MRLIAVTIAALFVAGCSSSPSAPNPVAVVPDAAPAAPAAPAAAAGATASTTAATYPGYKVKQYKGRTLYCKRTKQIGTRFENEICMTETELKRFMEAAERDREELRRTQSKCGTPSCGVGGG